MRLCRISVIILAVLWGLAAFLLAVGTFGWFGQPQDPLSGVFLLPLGLPWNGLLDRLGVPGPASALFAPAINIGLLAAICRWRRRQRTER